MVIAMQKPEDITRVDDSPRCECDDKSVHYEADGDLLLTFKLCFRCGAVEVSDESRAA